MINRIHRYLLISVIILLLSSKLLLGFEIFSFITYLDEILLLYLFVIIFYSFAVLKLDRYVFYLSIAICYMIFISVWMNSSGMQNIVLQSFIHMKFFIFYFVVDKYLKYNDLRKIGWFLFVFTILGLFLNLILQETFNQILLQRVDYRSGFLRIGGFQQNANLLGLILGLFYLFLLLCGKITKKNMILLTIIFSLLIFITGSRSSFLIIVIGISYYYLFGSVKSKIYMMPTFAILLVGLLGVLSYSDMLDRTMNNILMIENSVNSGYIRGIMLVNGFYLFFDYFPIGTGAATFGSVLSEGSYIYYVLGLSDKSFFLNMSGIYDSNLATIGGEFGFIGVLIYSFLLISIYQQIKNKNNKPYLLSVITVMLVMSVTNPIFMNAYPSMLFVLALVYEKKKAALHEFMRQRSQEITPYQRIDKG